MSVSDPLAAGRAHDYADSFELRLDEPDRWSPEEWVRAGIDGLPTWIKLVAGARNGLDSARVADSRPDVVVLEDSDALMDTVLVGRNVAPDRRVFTTVLRYRRPGQLDPPRRDRLESAVVQARDAAGDKH